METGRMRNLYSLWMEKSEQKTQTKSQRQINLST